MGDHVKPPAEGEVAELVEKLKTAVHSLRLSGYAFETDALARAAELLQRQAGAMPVWLPENPPAHLLPAGCDLDEWGLVVRETWKAARREVERQALQPVPLLPNSAQAIEPAERTLLVPALQLVPDEQIISRHDLRAEWDAEADDFNDWDSLGEDEKLEWAQQRAIAADRARHALQPVPVSERLPGPEDCDAHGRCWLLSKIEPAWRLFIIEPEWRLLIVNSGVPRLGYAFSHWLPAHSLPLPEVTE